MKNFLEERISYLESLLNSKSRNRLDKIKKESNKNNLKRRKCINESFTDFLLMNFESIIADELSDYPSYSVLVENSFNEHNEYNIKIMCNEGIRARYIMKINDKDEFVVFLARKKLFSSESLNKVALFIAEDFEDREVRGLLD